MLRSSLLARALVLSSLSLLAAPLVGCGGDDSSGGDVPQNDSGFNDAITERPDDGVDSAKADGGTDGGTDTATTDGGTDTLVADGGTDTATTEGGTDAAETASDTGTFIEITVGGTSFTFSPSTKNIKVGDTVRWTWAGPSHSVTSGTVSGIVATPDGKFDSGVLLTGATFTHKFDTAGTFTYYCSVHFSAGMTGSIVVAP